MLAAQSVAVPVKEQALKIQSNILLVDDQPEGLLAGSAILEPLGENVVKASSGKEALRRLLEMDFAVILLDVQMPDMDGFETAALIRQRERSKAVPIIFMTAAHTSEANVFRGYEVGAVDYIFKPVVPEILRSKVSVFVELARKTDLIREQAVRLREAERREHEKQIEDALAFSHAVSHDLRSPLRHILSFSELLSSVYGPGMDAQGRDYLLRLGGAVKKMMHLIDGMLKLSQATREELQRELVDLSKIAEELEAELRRSDPERAVEFGIEKDVCVIGDPNLLQLALENLFRNAWKYTRKKERAHIAFGRVKNADGWAYYVRDDGAGFDMAHADRLFVPFHRLHAPSDFEGTGIGLATVSRIIVRHAGKIWAESKPGLGATFYFTLPS